MAVGAGDLDDKPVDRADLDAAETARPAGEDVAGGIGVCQNEQPSVAESGRDIAGVACALIRLATAARRLDDDEASGGAERFGDRRVRHIPERGRGGGVDGGRAVRRHKHLRGARKQLLDQNALAVGFKATFDLIDDHDRMLGMMGCRDLERRKSPCSRPPACHGQHGAILGCGETDQRIKRKTRTTDSSGAIRLRSSDRSGASPDRAQGWTAHGGQRFCSDATVARRCRADPCVSDVLSHLRTEGMAMMKRFLAEGDAALPEGWPPAEQWFEEHSPGMMEAHSLISWLSRIVLHDEMTDRFAKLHWWVKEFKPEAPKLLLSDLPIHWEGGLNTGKFFIQLPIAPDRIFFGTEHAETEAFLNALPGAELIRRVNRGSLASSSNRIWGRDAQEGRTFIEANLDIVGANVERFDVVAERHGKRQERENEAACPNKASFD